MYLILSVSCINSSDKPALCSSTVRQRADVLIKANEFLTLVRGCALSATARLHEHASPLLVLDALFLSLSNYLVVLFLLFGLPSRFLFYYMITVVSREWFVFLQYFYSYKNEVLLKKSFIEWKTHLMFSRKIVFVHFIILKTVQLT